MTLDELPQRQRQVLELLAAGQQNKQIAHAFGISRRTVEIHRANLMRSIGAKTAAQAALIWHQMQADTTLAAQRAAADELASKASIAEQDRDRANAMLAELVGAVGALIPIAQVADLPDLDHVYLGVVVGKLNATMRALDAAQQYLRELSPPDQITASDPDPQPLDALLAADWEA